MTTPVKNHWTPRKAIAAVAAALLAAVGLTVSSPSPALAVSQGVGFGTYPDNTIGWQGSFIAPNGDSIYCIQPGVANPTNTSIDGGYVTRVSANRSAGISRVITEYGQTGSPIQASAVSFAVKALAGWDTFINSHGYPHGSAYTQANFERFVDYVLYYNATAAERDQIGALGWQYLQVGMNTTAGSGGSGSIEFTIDPTNEYRGTVKVNSSSSGAVGTLVLTNGIFDSTGTSTLAGAQLNTEYAVLGTPPDDGTDYKISVTGQFSAGYAGEFRLWSHSGQQDTAGPGRAASFTVSGTDPVFRGSQFGPVVSTNAIAFANVGDYLTDTITFDTQADDEGVNNPWFRFDDGTYLPVTATGTLYGPFTERPVEAASAPVGAPVAGTATVTTSTANGPTVAYTATSDTAVSESGFYTWVWEVDWAAQPSVTQLFVPGPSPLNPEQEPYNFTDRFGLLTETTIVASPIEAVSTITAEEIRPGDITHDRIVVSAPRGWIEDGGERIPVVFRGTAYFHAGEEAPEQTSSIPASAVNLGSITYTVTAPGSYLPATGLQVPLSGTGYVTWVWEIRAVDQPEQYRGWVAAWRDDYGIPAETQVLLRSTVVTQAQTAADAGAAIFDTAVVTGALPIDGADLTFEAYRVPLTPATDGLGGEVVDYPAGTTPGDYSWVCTTENLVFASDPVHITQIGEHRSPDFVPDAPGMYLWVETLTASDDSIIHRGECGIPNEISYVLDVETQAATAAGRTSDVQVGTLVWDTATVTGFVPEGAVTRFEAYLVEKSSNVPLAQRCTADTLAWVSPDVALVGDRLYTADAPLTVTGEGNVFDPDYKSQLYWVEVTTLADGTVLSRGDCGDPNETMGLRGTIVIASGGSIAGVVIAAGAGVAALGGAGLLLTLRRRRRRSS